MIPTIQEELLKKLAQACERSPGIRLGQLVAHLEFLSQDDNPVSLAELEDEALLQILDRYLADLAQRQSQVA